ncbi:acetyl-CoA carboxylase biotin carboxyl carrier protein subunit [Thermodesulfobacteriota bacterium]
MFRRFVPQTIGKNLTFLVNIHILDIFNTTFICKNEKSEWSIYLNVDHQERNYTFKEEAKEGAAAAGPQLSKKEIEDLAKAGDMRATYSCNVCEIVAKEDEEVAVGDKLAVVEAMKMQTPVVSQVAGTVVEIQAKVGDALKVGDKILKIITEVE